jgi:hypothetical protein
MLAFLVPTIWTKCQSKILLLSKFTTCHAKSPWTMPWNRSTFVDSDSMTKQSKILNSLCSEGKLYQRTPRLKKSFQQIKATLLLSSSILKIFFRTLRLTIFAKTKSNRLCSFLKRQFSRLLRKKKAWCKWSRFWTHASRTGTIGNNLKYGNSIWMSWRVTLASQCSALCTWTSKTMSSCCLTFYQDCQTSKIQRNGLIWKRVQ